jgi:cell wall-associated NlpC family hydrolase
MSAQQGRPTATTLTAAAVALLTAPTLLIVPGAALLTGTAAAATAAGCGPAGHAAQVAGLDLDAEQLANAAVIVTTTADAGMPGQGAVIAVATALQESSLRNLASGDRDSLGLFQQRASWGPAPARLDPAAATALFLAALGAVPDWQVLPVTVASDRVQHSGYPWAVARWEPAATALTVRYWPTTPPTAPPTAATAARTSAPSTPSRSPSAPRPAPPSAPRPVPPSGAAAAASGDLCPGRGSDNTPTAVGVTALPPGYQAPTNAQQGTVVAFALEQLGKPYLWGAAGPDSWDCSGLTMRAWGAAGIALARTTFQQVLTGTPVSSPAAMAPGDLIFTAGLDGTAANPGHVGMYIGAVDGAPSLVHAPRTGKNVEINPVSSWAGQIVAIRRPTPTR